MRTMDEVIDVFKNPRGLKSDFYKVGLIELYPFIPVEYIPEIHRTKMDPKALEEWNPEEEYNNFNFKEALTEELKYLHKLVVENEINAAVFRTPRAFALIWLSGDSIERYDNSLYKIEISHMPAKKAAIELKKLYKVIGDKYQIEYK